MSKLLQSALKYASRGFSVFPCRPRGKEPITENGCKDATTDAERITKWWTENPSANIGIATGAPSGFVVLDVDNKENEGVYGSESLRLWESEFTPLPKTWTVLTGGGGTHYLFKTDKEVRNRAGVLDGIDVRGDGGYIIAPPSIHPNGSAYAWEATSFDIKEPALLPEDLYNLMRPDYGDNQKFEMPETIPQGRRNDTLFKYAASLQAKGLSDCAISAAVRAENQTRCSVPLGDAELDLLIQSALRYEKGGDLLDEEVVKANIDAALEAEDDKSMLLSRATFASVYAVADSFAREEYYMKLRDKAKDMKCVKEFEKLWAAYKKSYVQKKKQRGSNVVKFTDPPISGLNCKDWVCDDLGVRRTISKGDDSYEEWACPHPILPVERLVNIDSETEKVKIAFAKDGQWRTVIVNMTSISTRNKIVELADTGISVTSENARLLVEFLYDILNINLDLIPQYSSVGRLGWMNDMDEFSPYTTQIKFDGEAAYREYYAAVRTRGNYDKWLSVAGDARAADPIVKCVMAASFASPIIEILGKLPFFVHLWGADSGIGKTVALMLAMSVWGDPSEGKLLRNFNASFVGMERVAAFAYSIPVAFNELQTIKKGNDFDSIIYMLCEGTGKIRGNTRGGVDTMNKWRNCFLTTGEQALTTSYSGAGAKNRTLEIECVNPLFTDAPRVADMSRENFGFAGYDFIELLKKEESQDRVRSYYDSFYDVLGDDVLNKQRMAGALLLTADKMACDYIFKTDECLTISEIKEFFTDRNEIDIINRAYEHLIGWISQNEDRFKETMYGEHWGRFVDTKTVAVINKVIEDELRNAGFHYKAIMSGLGRRGLLRRDAQKGNTFPVRIGQNIVRCAVINVSGVNYKNDEVLKDSDDDA